MAVRRVYITGREIFVSKPGKDALVAAAQNRRDLLLSLDSRQYQVIKVGYISTGKFTEGTSTPKEERRNKWVFVASFPTQPVVPDVIVEACYQGTYYAGNGYRMGDDEDRPIYDTTITRNTLTVNLSVKNNPRENWYGIAYAVFRKGLVT